MNKLVISGVAILLSMVSPFASAQYKQCNGVVPSLDEMKYMDEEDLKLKICFWEHSGQLYLNAMAIDSFSQCNEAAKLARKVLEKDFDAKPPTAAECKEKF